MHDCCPKIFPTFICTLYRNKGSFFQMQLSDRAKSQFAISVLLSQGISRYLFTTDIRNQYWEKVTFKSNALQYCISYFFITLSHLTWACLFNFNIQMFYYGRSKSPFTPKVKWISFRLKDVNSKSSNKPFSCAAILDCMKNKTKEKKASNHKKSSLLIWLNWLIEGQQQRHFNNNK